MPVSPAVGAASTSKAAFLKQVAAQIDAAAAKLKSTKPIMKGDVPVEVDIPNVEDARLQAADFVGKPQGFDSALAAVRAVSKATAGKGSAVLFPNGHGGYVARSLITDVTDTYKAPGMFHDGYRQWHWAPYDIGTFANERSLKFKADAAVAFVDGTMFAINDGQPNPL